MYLIVFSPQCSLISWILFCMQQMYEVCNLCMLDVGLNGCRCRCTLKRGVASRFRKVAPFYLVLFIILSSLVAFVSGQLTVSNDCALLVHFTCSRLYEMLHFCNWFKQRGVTLRLSSKYCDLANMLRLVSVHCFYSLFWVCLTKLAHMHTGKMPRKVAQCN